MNYRTYLNVAKIGDEGAETYHVSYFLANVSGPIWILTPINGVLSPVLVSRKWFRLFVITHSVFEVLFKPMGIGSLILECRCLQNSTSFESGRDVSQEWLKEINQK